MSDEKTNYVYYQVISIDGTPRAYFRTIEGYKNLSIGTTPSKSGSQVTRLFHIMPRETHFSKGLTTSQRHIVEENVNHTNYARSREPGIRQRRPVSIHIS